jgi:excisionase family DNA binding protein
MIKKQQQPIAVRAREAAQLLGVSQRTFDRMIAAGDIPFWRLHGRTYRMFAVKDLEAYVERRLKQEASRR